MDGDFAVVSSSFFERNAGPSAYSDNGESDSPATVTVFFVPTYIRVLEIMTGLL